MRFEITFDYLCPFARNANEAVVEGLRRGREWDVAFRPFSLAQVHVENGESDVFTDTTASGILALQWGVAIRDSDPEEISGCPRRARSQRDTTRASTSPTKP